MKKIVKVVSEEQVEQDVKHARLGKLSVQGKVVCGEKTAEEPADSQPRRSQGRVEDTGRRGYGRLGGRVHQEVGEVGQPGHDCLHGPLQDALLPVYVGLVRNQVLPQHSARIRSFQQH